MIQHYAIKFVSGLQQVWWFDVGTPVSSTNKNDRHEILLKVALNRITLPYI
jgi:hypothetical protein